MGGGDRGGGPRGHTAGGAGGPAGGGCVLAGCVLAGGCGGVVTKGAFPLAEWDALQVGAVCISTMCISGRV